MTNDTIDQEARVTQAAIARLLRHAAVGTDLDAARLRVMRTPYLRTPYLRAIAVSAKENFTAMTANRPSRPLGVAKTNRWAAQPAT